MCVSFNYYSHHNLSFIYVFIYFSFIIDSHLCYLGFLAVKMTLHPVHSGVQFQYFFQHTDNKVFKDLAAFTNQRQLQTRGVPLNTTSQGIKIFFGKSVHMAALAIPESKCFLPKKKKKKMPVISSKMVRNWFFKLRSSLKIVDDLDVTEETKKVDILWRVRPLLDRVMQGCLSLPKSETVCRGVLSGLSLNGCGNISD